MDRRRTRGGELEGGWGGGGATTPSCFIPICLTYIFMILKRYVNM